MNLLTLDVKKKIREVTEEVANKVGNVSFVIISGNEILLIVLKILSICYFKRILSFFNLIFLSSHLV